MRRSSGIEQGYIFVPYIIVNVATSVNGEIVWYKNKWKNLGLKIKRLFIKSKHLNNLNKKILCKYTKHVN